MSQQFTHLHVHSHYSVLDGMSKVPDIVDKCIANGMYSVALTDHGVMYGMKEFADYVGKVNGKTKSAIKEQEAILSDAERSEADKQTAQAEIDKLRAKIFKPIYGVEAYCARRRLTDKDGSIRATDPETGRESVLDRSGWHLILLAKNKEGYKSLCKLVSVSWIDGFYGKPRIDKDLIAKYHEGVICCSACLGGEVPQLIMNGKVDEAEQTIKWFKSIFADDYYLEIQRHPTPPDHPSHDVWERQQQVLPVIVELARRTDTKIVCTNDSHFIDADNAEAHDRLICLSTNANVSDTNRMHYTGQEWLKTPDEMATLFADYPEALANTMEVAAKVEPYDIGSGPIMPKFEIPTDFGTEEEYRERLTEKDLFDEFTQDENGKVVLSPEKAAEKIKKLGGYEKLYRIKLEADYLAKLAWEGAHKRYGETLTDEQTDRIRFELHIMKTMGFPGYFLIVMDYIRQAREELDVWVGPGRGSAAGSVVAYCLWITDIDPLKYDLLFERFLNPDRISLPDIDVDFADDGRGKVLDYVTRKYGKDHVSHLITYGTMATKSAVADVGRVQGVPLSTVNQIKKLIPDKFPEDPKTGKAPKVNLKNCYKLIPEFRQIYDGPDPNLSSMLHYAEQLEDTVRQTGIHACGFIIGADDLSKFAPIATVKDKETGENVQVTQYDGHYVESVGLIKMDFLGLITLRIMKEAVSNIKKRHGIDLDIFSVPIDDPETYRLYAEGRTVGTFQFESPGMRKYLKELKPTVFEDLIAMNALYRPGPMDYIPQFIARKSGREPITYDIPVMEKYLKDTYGVTVYQEQVMLLSRLLADFTRGESDQLRKAMGKKQIAVLNALKPKFINGGEKNGYDAKVLEKIWADWEKFASYAFNKSHATCYSWVAYQTAYLKAHYPAEYMAALLTSVKDKYDDVAKYMDECKQMGLGIHGPDVNNSELNFSVSADGSVVFGLGGVKGVGTSAVESIISERNRGGNFKSIYDFVERVNLTACNRKTMESLAMAGAFDSLGDVRREQFFVQAPSGLTGSEILLRYGTSFQNDSHEQQNNLFGDSLTVSIAKPLLPEVPNPWSDLERLNHEKDVVGNYISSHPLAMFSFEMKYIANTRMTELAEDNLEHLLGRNFVCCGIVTGVRNGMTKKQMPYLVATIEDMDGSGEFALFNKDYTTYATYFQPNAYVCITGRVEKSQYSDRINKNISSVMYMSDMLHSGRIHSVTLDVDLECVDRSLVDLLSDVLVENSRRPQVPQPDAPPCVPVRFRISDHNSKIDVRMSSSSYSVELGPRIMNFVEETEGVEMMVN